MKKKVVREQRQRVQELLDKWLKPLGLLWWDSVVDYKTHKRKPHRENFDVPFHVDVLWPYNEAYIIAYLPVIVKMNDRDLEEGLVHELCHILVAEMQSAPPDMQDHTEHVVVGLSRAFIWTWLYAAGQKKD